MIEQINTFIAEHIIGYLIIIFIIAIWSGIWKIIALWKSARNSQKGWFITIAIFNTLGILPILYIWKFQKPKQKQE